MANIHLKTALDHIRRSPFQALSAFFVLTITFFVITMLSILVYSSGQLIKHFETRPQIIAFLVSDAQDSDINSLKAKLESDQRVKSVEYVSKEQALEIYKRATSDNPLLSELVSPSIFPASLEVSLNDLSHAQNVIDEIKQDKIVDQVGFTASLGNEDSLTDVVQRLRRISLYVRVGGGVFAGVLTATSLLVLIVIIGMRMTTRRKEIEILDLIGATPGFIRSPIIIEAVIYAASGVFMGWLLAFLLTLYSTPTLFSYFGDIPILPQNLTELFIIFLTILLGEMLVGFILALVGGSLAVSRVRKRK